MTDIDTTDLTAADVAWNVETLLPSAATPDELLDRADELADQLTEYRGRVGALDATEMTAVMSTLAELTELITRAGSYVRLRFTENTADEARGAAMASVEERATAISTKLLFIDLEWAQADPDHAAAVEADERLSFCAHHLHQLRKNQQYLLAEAEERILAEKAITASSAWVRLFEEQTAAIQVELADETVSLMGALSKLLHPEVDTRQNAAHAVTAALEPGLKTRAFIFNNLLLDKSVEDRLREYPSWISSRNLANEATDESVQALITAVVGRYDIPQRWYRLKAQALGFERLADYDRMASVADSEQQIGWAQAQAIVRDSYRSFSPELGDIVDRFFDEGWIDAPMRPGKRGGAFCAPTVPSHHPYVMLNWTSNTRDVSTLAHELGHGVHGYLSRGQGIFHMNTPLTLAETASVFGEALTNNRLLELIEDPNERFALLATTVEDSIATVFRQVAMNRFEDAVHTERRDVGELSVDRFSQLWHDSQAAMLGDSVEITDGYRTWWSYIPHFIAVPGYVYAYAYGQLLALSVYARYQDQGQSFVPSYLELLAAGGSQSPEQLGAIVGCDLADPAFWDAGLAIVEDQLNAAEAAAQAAGRI